MSTLFPTRRLTEAEKAKEAEILAYGHLDYAKEMAKTWEEQFNRNRMSCTMPAMDGKKMEDYVLDSLKDSFASEARRAAIVRLHGKGFVIGGRPVECLFEEPFTAAFEALVETKVAERYKELGVPYTPKPPADLLDLSGTTSIPKTRLVEWCARNKETNALMCSWAEFPIAPEHAPPKKKSPLEEELEGLFAASPTNSETPTADLLDIGDLYNKPIVTPEVRPVSPASASSSDSESSEPESSAREKGFELEDTIHTALTTRGHECLREQDIRNTYGKSFNGVDHLVKHGDTYIFIQDKWEAKGAGQRAVAQFVNCAMRIKERLPAHAQIHLIWASKYTPTSNGIALLEEKKASIITESASIDALTTKVVEKTSELLRGVSSQPAGVMRRAEPAITVETKGRTVARVRKCDGCLNKVSVRVPTDSPIYQFCCPICSYSVTKNSY